MWFCISNNAIKKSLFSAFALLAGMGLVFFWLQNKGAPGGDVASVKVIWLAFAILMWFIVPALMLLDGRYDIKSRKLLAVFLVNMLLRAGVELLMMYVTQNWHPYYGISHNLFTVLLLLFIIYHTPSKILTLFSSFIIVLVLMFISETGFALYMLNNVHAEGPVYFVPQAGHDSVLLTTWFVVFAISVYLVLFVRGWLYER